MENAYTSGTLFASSCASSIFYIRTVIFFIIIAYLLFISNNLKTRLAYETLGHTHTRTNVVSPNPSLSKEFGNVSDVVHVSTNRL